MRGQREFPLDRAGAARIVAIGDSFTFGQCVDDAADLGKIVRGTFEAGDERFAGLISGEYLKSGDRRIGGGERIAPSDYEAIGARVALSATPNETDAWFFDLQYAKQPSTPRTDELRGALERERAAAGG